MYICPLQKSAMVLPGHSNPGNTQWFMVHSEKKTKAVSGVVPFFKKFK